MDNMIAIPKQLSKQIIKRLYYSTQQGVAGMKARARETVYWPGMDAYAITAPTV